MAIEVIKARTKQQIEQGYAVREQTMVRGEGVPHDVEFDDDSAESPVYFLALSNGEPLGTCRAVKLAAQKNISVQSSASDQEEAAVQNSASDRGDAAVQKAQKGAAIGNNTAMQTDAGRKDIAASQEDAAAAEDRFADTVKLERIAVLTNRQHSGIGTALIRGAEDILRREGVKKVIINSRDKALSFYERLGYRRMSAADAEYCLALLPKISRYEEKNRCSAADIPAVPAASKNVPNTAGNVHSAPVVLQNIHLPDCVDDRGFPGYLVEHIL